MSMHHHLKLISGLVLSIAIIPVCLAQTPYFSADGDTAYIGENAIVRDKSTSHITGPAPNLFNTITTTTWGEDMRLTYLTDIGGLVTTPFPFRIDDFLGVYATVLYLGDFYVVYHTYSLDSGVSWSLPDSFNLDSTGVCGAGGIDTVLYFWGIKGYTWINIYFMRSFDTGGNWVDYHEFENSRVNFIGKNTLTAHGDSVFITYNLFERPETDVDSIMFSMSEDRGFSWSDIRGILYASNDTYPHWVRTSLNRMHIVFPSFAPNSQEIFYSYSDDFGFTWLDPVVISDNDSVISQWPFFSADDSGNLCVSWYDYKYGSGPSGFTGDLLYRISRDNGETWSDERRLTRDHFCTASRSIIDGNYLAFIWLDHYQGLLHGNLSFTESHDAGITWSEKVELTNNGPEHNVMIHELLYDGDYIYLFWLDDRDSYLFNHELYFNRGEVSSTSISENQVVPVDFVITSVYPNPFNSTVTISVSGTPADMIIEIYDILGRFRESLKIVNNEAVWDASGYSSGVYFARARSSHYTEVRKLLFLK